MSRGRRLTLEQKKCVSAHYMNPKEWMLKEETEFYLKVTHKITGMTRTLDKFRGKIRDMNSEQKRIASLANLDCREWKVFHQDESYIHLIRKDGTKRVILTTEGEVVRYV